ncbi:MAG: hypothetical protein M3186_03400 [Actinomycetota bacterium]|nr:hypothetical protein [Actinomycetota bacterium]
MSTPEYVHDGLFGAARAGKRDVTRPVTPVPCSKIASLGRGGTAGAD